MGGSRHNGFRASQVLHVVVLFLQSVSLRSRKRTFSERYLRLVKLRNFDLPEDTATKRPCRVYYTYMRKCVREDTAHMSLYNTRLAWAG